MNEYAASYFESRHRFKIQRSQEKKKKDESAPPAAGKQQIQILINFLSKLKAGCKLNAFNQLSAGGRIGRHSKFKSNPNQTDAEV